jgi:hypothetical protein
MIGAGGYAEVYEGELEEIGMKIAVKRFRLVLSKEKEFAKVRRAWIVIRIHFLSIL